ncbi:MAG: amidohydrolase family protein [Aggregatilineales bacterium]
MSANPPLRIANARVLTASGPAARDIYTAGERIAARAGHGVLTVDLAGHTVYPGWINAHDHLELNHYPRTKFREVYANAHQWGEDVNARLNAEPYRSLRAYPLRDRLFIGGLKNLLCGATTVVHHGPPHRLLYRRDFPVRVLRQYGWAHSLRFSPEAEVARSYRRTPPDWPWFIHLAEGTDDTAAGEYQRLKALGCVGANTVLVHGVGLTAADIADAVPRIRALVWCPTTNNYLLGKTLNPALWGNKLVLGSDSRLTADGDWLAELRSALCCSSVDQRDVFAFVSRPAALLGLKRAGSLVPGNYADWLAAPAFPTARRDIALVVRGGVPLIGNPPLMAQFPHVPTVAAVLDGAEKRIHLDLARQIHRCCLREPGLFVDSLPTTRRVFFS